MIMQNLPGPHYLDLTLGDHPGEGRVVLGQDDKKENGGGGGFLITALLMVTAGAVGFAFGIDRSSKRSGRF